MVCPLAFHPFCSRHTQLRHSLIYMWSFEVIMSTFSSAPEFLVRCTAVALCIRSLIGFYYATVYKNNAIAVPQVLQSGHQKNGNFLRADEAGISCPCPTRGGVMHKLPSLTLSQIILSTKAIALISTKHGGVLQRNVPVWLWKSR